MSNPCCGECGSEYVDSVLGYFCPVCTTDEDEVREAQRDGEAQDASRREEKEMELDYYEDERR